MSLNETLHIEIASSTSTRVEASMPITPDLYQPFGFLHGGATIALLESAASRGAEENADFETERPFGVDVRVRHRKSGKAGVLRGVAELDRQEISERSGAIKQFWNVAAYDEEGDTISDGVIVTKIVSLEYLDKKAREREAARSAEA